jgi:predicted acylesterase/phospholipase RssA
MGEVADGRRFTVLSIDGGGVRGIFAAAVLASLERDTGTRITDHFDLVVGTSTGGIIALGLGAGMSPEEILALYLGNANSIFPAWRRSILARPLSLVRAKYKADGLRRVVQQVFGGHAALRKHGAARDSVLQHRRERGVPVQDPAPRAAAAGLECAHVAGRHGDHGRADVLSRLLAAR